MMKTRVSDITAALGSIGDVPSRLREVVESQPGNIAHITDRLGDSHVAPQRDLNLAVLLGTVAPSGQSAKALDSAEIAAAVALVKRVLGQRGARVNVAAALSTLDSRTSVRQHAFGT